LPIAFAGLLFAVFAAFLFEAPASAWGEYISRMPVAAPFAAIGLGCLSAPFWMIRKALRTAYLPTDRRAIVIEADWWRSRTVYSFWPAQLRHMQGYFERDGSGDLVFGERQEENGRVDIGFIAIRNVAAVEQLLHALLRQNRMKHVSTVTQT
jgi:predicted lipoprotein